MIQQQSVAESEPFFPYPALPIKRFVIIMCVGYICVCLHKQVNICKYVCYTCKIHVLPEQRIRTVNFYIAS